MRMKPYGLFIGRSTVDVISVVERFPQPNEKITSQAQRVMSGGPALNAAITFSHFGGSAALLSTFGAGLFGQFAADECRSHGVRIIDRAEGASYDFPLSSIISSPEASSRCVINPPFQTRTFPAPAPSDLPGPLSLVMLDQFEADAMASLLPMLRELQIPIVLDGGSWRQRSEQFLDAATIPIVSSHFNPPRGSRQDIVACLSARNYPQWAITCGPEGVLYYDNGATGQVAPIPVEAIDTLGAGDIFHGAFCAAFAAGRSFVAALEFANAAAAESCKHPGTRQWMTAGLKL
jgi:sugar/nucleoside kinase (ribokinase family)